MKKGWKYWNGRRSRENEEEDVWANTALIWLGSFSCCFNQSSSFYDYPLHNASTFVWLRQLLWVPKWKRDHFSRYIHFHHYSTTRFMVYSSRVYVKWTIRILLYKNTVYYVYLKCKIFRFSLYKSKMLHTISN